jgi:hypothetical protein
VPGGCIHSIGRRRPDSNLFLLCSVHDAKCMTGIVTLLSKSSIGRSYSYIRYSACSTVTVDADITDVAVHPIPFPPYSIITDRQSQNAFHVESEEHCVRQHTTAFTKTLMVKRPLGGRQEKLEMNS